MKPHHFTSTPPPIVREQIKVLSGANGQLLAVLIGQDGEIIWATSKIPRELLHLEAMGWQSGQKIELVEVEKKIEVSNNNSIHQIPHLIEERNHKYYLGVASYDFYADSKRIGSIRLVYDIDYLFRWFHEGLNTFLLIISAIVLGVFFLFLALEVSLVHRSYLSRLRSAEKNRSLEAIAFSKIQEGQLLSELGGWLHTSNSLGEFSKILLEFMQYMFPDYSGAIYLFDGDRRFLHKFTGWNCKDSDISLRLHPHDCWGLRRGRLYEYGKNIVNFRCNHSLVGEECYSICIPIVANGEAHGLVHIADPCNTPKSDEQYEQDKRSALACIEQISMALANVSLRDRLEEQTIRDPLTGLLNRRGFYRYFDEFRAENPDQPLYLVCLDVDHFKSFNDNYGHEIGDEVLVHLGRVLRRIGSGNAFRLGGEEFALLIPFDKELPIRAQLEKLRTTVSQIEIKYQGQIVKKVTASFGYVLCPQDGEEIEDLLKIADNMVYAAKDAGRNCVKSLEDMNQK